MRDNYNFSNSKPNPYSKRLKKQITIRIDDDTIQYFEKLAEEKGSPYQALITLQPRDRAESKRDLNTRWA